MPIEYQWAEADGSLSVADYNQATDTLSREQVFAEIQSAVSQFGHEISCERYSDEYPEVVKFSFREDDVDVDYFIAIKEMTPGGRDALKNEQRVQQKAKYINLVYQQHANGHKAFLMGVYKRHGDTIFCAWKLKESGAAPETPVSRQMKITTIASAMKEGFAQQDKGQGEYACAFRREFLFFYFKNAGWLHDGNVTTLNAHSEPIPDDPDIISGGENILLYGVPGAGKSFTIQEEYLSKANSDCMERLVFHPDYTYSDFVGQILPTTVSGHVEYIFTPGPFTRLLKKATADKKREYFLVIEEINRGNAPAIFGDIFQLLDRVEETDYQNGITIGESQYGITNADIAREVYGDSDHPVKIPANMTILATMNTADQNVFTLDTAFQRRWHMRMIPNTFIGHQFAENKILDTSISWQQFCLAINEEIIKKSAAVTSSEDKRLGAYFVSREDLVLLRDDSEELSPEEKKRARRHNRLFAEKVIKYLWDDAFKYSRGDIFEVSNYNSLEAIIQQFMEKTGDDRLLIFKEEIRNAFKTPKE